jgi:hypothetical protein
MHDTQSLAWAVGSYSPRKEFATCIVPKCMGEQMFRKSTSHFKILDTNWVAWGKIRTEDPYLNLYALYAQCRWV